MNVYEIKSMAERLDGNTYPGRGIVLGITPDGKKAVAAYFIMGRSVNSQFITQILRFPLVKRYPLW